MNMLGPPGQWLSLNEFDFHVRSLFLQMLGPFLHYFIDTRAFAENYESTVFLSREASRVASVELLKSFE